MCVNHGRAHVPVAEQLLDCADVVPILEEVCGKRMAEGVAGRMSGNPGSADGVPDRALQHRLMQVVPAPLAGHPVDVDPGSRKDPLPTLLPARVRVLPHQGSRELDPAGTAPEVLLVLSPHTVEVPRQVGFDSGGQHRHAVSVALAGPHNDLISCEVDVLHAQAGALQNPQSRPVQQQRHQARDAVKMTKKCPNLIASQDNGKPPGALCAHKVIEPRNPLIQHLAVEEQKRAQRLVLGGGRHFSLDGERREKLRDLRGAHLDGMALAVEQDVSADPRDVCLLGTAAVVARAEDIPRAVKETWLPLAGRAGVTGGKAYHAAPSSLRALGSDSPLHW